MKPYIHYEIPYFIRNNYYGVSAQYFRRYITVTFSEYRLKCGMQTINLLRSPVVDKELHVPKEVPYESMYLL